MLLLTALIASILAGHCNAEIEAFASLNVVPDVVPELPPLLLKVTYDNGLVIKGGEEVTPTQVKNQPLVEWSAKPDEFYTLIMVDPDAPSRQEPKFREFKHWLVVNIPGNNVTAGQVLAEYVGAGPPQGTGLHRYVFLLYKQPGNLSFSSTMTTSNKSRSNRLSFHASKFAEHHQLGQAVAGTVFSASYDDYVPILHKQLSEN